MSRLTRRTVVIAGWTILSLCHCCIAPAQADRDSVARASRSPVDTSPLLKIEHAVLPPALVPGPHSQEDLTAYFVAANPELRDRLATICGLFERSPEASCRAITLVAGDAGVGKSFLKKECFKKKFAQEAVFKMDLREQYEEWEKEGTVARRPDLACGDLVLNTLLARSDTQSRPISQLLGSQSANFFVIDSLDEVHPDEYLSTLEQIEEFVATTKTQFVHVVVFGRPFAFVEYWRSRQADAGARNIQLFMLSPPQLQTTGDLMVSSWNYTVFKYGAGWPTSDGQVTPLSLQDYLEWAQDGFSRSGRFERIVLKENQDVSPRVQDALASYAQQYRSLGPLLYNLAGNAIAREIVAQQVLHGMPFDEHQMMSSFFDAWLERDYRSDGRPSFAHSKHVELYVHLLEQVAVKYLSEKRLDREGYFAVANNDVIRLNYDHHIIEFPVRQILDRSGMKHLDPRQVGELKYRFEPIWLHRLLVEQHNSRLGAHLP